MKREMLKMLENMKCCSLCPRKCKVNRMRGKPGVCGEGSVVRIARAAPHFGEEPCISGTKGSGAVFFSGCSLHCVYCQNKLLSNGEVGKQIENIKLVDIFTDLQNAGVHNINLVTPTQFVPQIIKALKTAKKRGLILPVVYNCGGYELMETIDMLNGYVDIYMPDFKYYTKKTSERYSFAPDYPKYAKSALKQMVTQVGAPLFSEQGIMKRGVIVRHLLLPSHLNEAKRIVEYLYKTYNNEIYISLLSQYTPMKNVQYEELKQTVRKREYYELVDYALSLGVENAFIQELDASGENFIPVFDGTGVE